MKRKPDADPKGPALVRHFFKQQMKYKNKNTYGNRTVGNIKGRPVKIAKVNVKKVHDISKPESVNQVSDGSSKNQSKTGCKERRSGGVFFYRNIKSTRLPGMK